MDLEPVVGKWFIGSCVTWFSFYPQLNGGLDCDLPQFSHVYTFYCDSSPEDLQRASVVGISSQVTVNPPPPQCN